MFSYGEVRISIWKIKIELQTAFAKHEVFTILVNYFLSGLHSYAAGDPMPIPNFVYNTLGVIGIIATTAYINNRNNSKNISSG